MIFDASSRPSARRVEGLRFRGPLAPRLDPPPKTDTIERLKVCYKKLRVFYISNPDVFYLQLKESAYIFVIMHLIF